LYPEKKKQTEIGQAGNILIMRGGKCMRRLVTVGMLALLLAFASTAWAAVSTEELLQGVDSPDGVLTRGEFAAMLVKAAGMEQEMAPPDLLVQKDILKGTGNGDLALDQQITGVEAVTLVARTLGFSDAVTPPADANTSLDPAHWGYSLYAWLEKLGLAGGEPEDLLSEDQGAALLSKTFTTSPEAQEILAQSQNTSQATNSMRSVAFGKMQMNGRPGIEGATELSDLEINFELTQEIILPDKIHQLVNTKAELPEIGLQNSAMEQYIVDGRLYQKITDPETGEAAWMKFPGEIMPDLEALIEQQKQQTEVIPPELEKYFHYQLLGTTTIDSREVYQLAFYGRVDDYRAFMEAAMGQLGDLAPSTDDLDPAADLLQAMSYWGIEYIGVDDYLSYGGNYTASLTFADQFQGEANPLESMEMTFTIKDIDYTGGFVIELPQAALDAPELSPEEPQVPEPTSPDQP